MNLVERALRRVVEDLREMGLPYALVGGLAVSIRAEPRTTRDVDLALAVDGDSGAEQATRAFLERGYVLASLLEHEITTRLATARLHSPEPGGVGVDLLFCSSGIEAEIVARADALEILPGLHAVVAGPGDLVALKLLASAPHRSRDSEDLLELARVLTPADVAVARAAVRLIAERGYHRDRDLAALLEEYLADPPQQRTH